jgi:hypothetical protein
MEDPDSMPPWLAPVVLGYLTGFLGALLLRGLPLVTGFPAVPT